MKCWHLYISTLSIIIQNGIFYRQYATNLSRFVRFIGGDPLFIVVEGLFKELALGVEFKEVSLAPTQ